MLPHVIRERIASFESLVIMQVPFHKYVGPGNKLTEGDPVDSDDIIARLHDYAYEYGLVHESDRHFAIDFFWDSIINSNWHSNIGSIGLLFKYYLEEIIGVQYPQMAPTSSTTTRRPTHSGNRRYAEEQREWAEKFAAYKRAHGNISWQDFRKMHKSTPAPSVLQIGAPEPHRGGLRAYHNPGLRSAPRDWETPNVGHGNSQVAGPSRRQASQHSSSDDTQSGIGAFNSDDYIDDSDQDWSQLIPGQDRHMEVDNQQIQNDEGGRGSGGRANVIGTNSAGKHLTIPKSIMSKSFTLRFGKSRIMYSYGYAFQSILEIADKDPCKEHVSLCTPLANIPVEMLSFYLDDCEWNTYIKGASGTIIAKHAKCTVVPQGLRTAFDTGSTLSGTATSEHCAIGMSCIGLNHKYTNLVHYKYDSNADKPMIPTGCVPIDEDTYVNSFYGEHPEIGTNMAMVLGVPRHMNCYGVFKLNKGKRPLVTNKECPNYGVHDEGLPILDRYLNRFNFTPHIGEKIIDWEYTIQNGILGIKAYDLNYVQEQSDVIVHPAAVLTPTVLTVKQTKDGILNCAINSQPVAATNSIKQFHKAYIENTRQRFVHKQDPIALKTIPQVHVGIMPVPQLNPATDEENYQNTAAYFSVTCELVIEFNRSSIYPFTNAVHGTSNEIILSYGNNNGVNFEQRQPLGMYAYN